MDQANQQSVENHNEYDEESAGDDSNYEDYDENDEDEQQEYGNEYQIQDMSTQENLTENTATSNNDYAVGSNNNYTDSVSNSNLIYATLPP